MRYQRRQRTSRTHKTSGFVLIEVLVSVLILSVSLVVLLDSIRMSIDTNKIMQEYTIAMRLAQQKMWEMESKFMWQTGLEHYTNHGTFEGNESFVYDVETYVDTPRSEMKLVVIVTWTHRKREQSYQLATIIPLEKDEQELE